MPLELQYVRAGDLKRNPRNWRRHPDGQKAALRAVLDDVGWAGALLWNRRTEQLVDGHARLDVVDPDANVPVLVGDWTEEQELKILATLDPIAYLATVDREAIESLMKDVPLDNDLASIGKQLTKMAKGPVMVNDGNTDPNHVPAIEAHAITKRGDVIELGDHRLICGDSADPADVEKLLAGELVDLVNTDPPYNVEVEPRSNNALAQKPDSSTAKFDASRHGKPKPTGEIRPKDRRLRNDFKTTEEFDDLLRRWFVNIANALKPGGSFYVWGGFDNVFDYPPALTAAKTLRFSQLVIWIKEHPVLTRKDFMGNHEICFYGWKHGAAHRFLAPGNVPDTWVVKKIPPQKMVHLTEKPVELAIKAIECSSKATETVLDIFGGSGSTLIACEQTGRCARLVELDPLYCDVIVKRWEQFTGRKAKRPRRRAATASKRKR